MTTTVNNRDPVCGMTVDPATARYRYEHDGTTWLFCSESCKNAFMETPARFAATEPDVTTAPTRRTSIRKEALVVIMIFLAAVAVVLIFRPNKKIEGVSWSNGSIIGSTTSQDRSVDNGAGNVIVSATYEREKNAESVRSFVLSLNTHVVELTSFNPASQVRLRVGPSEIPPETVESVGERSSHHQNMRLTFPREGSGTAWIVVRDVGGIRERDLPFTL